MTRTTTNGKPPSRKQQKLKSQLIDSRLKRTYSEQKKQIVILGGCSSGKSSLRHSIYYLSNSRNCPDGVERERLIKQYVIKCLKVCWKVMKLEQDYHDEEMQNANALQHDMKNAKSGGIFSPKLIKLMKYLMVVKSDQLEYISHHFRYMENIRYFISEKFIAKLQLSSGAEFTMDDLLHTKIPHTKSSIYECSYLRNVFFDPSPQLNERRKWISQFDGLTRAMYLISLADYNLTDSITGMNCLRLASNNFIEFANYSEYHPSDVTIVFTKFDLFKEKLEKYPFADYFTEYTGPPNNSECVLNFIRSIIPEFSCMSAETLLNMTSFDNVKNLIQFDDMRVNMVVV